MSRLGLVLSVAKPEDALKAPTPPRPRGGRKSLNPNAGRGIVLRAEQASERKRARARARLHTGSWGSHADPSTWHLPVCWRLASPSSDEGQPQNET